MAHRNEHLVAWGEGECGRDDASLRPSLCLDSPLLGFSLIRPTARRDTAAWSWSSLWASCVRVCGCGGCIVLREMLELWAMMMASCGEREVLPVSFDHTPSTRHTQTPRQRLHHHHAHLLLLLPPPYPRHRRLAFASSLRASTSKASPSKEKSGFTSPNSTKASSDLKTYSKSRVKPFLLKYNLLENK